MEEEKRGGSGIFSLPTILIALAVASGLVWKSSPLSSPRPSVEGLPSASPEKEQNVESRMWQDPLAAIERAQSKGKAGAFQPCLLDKFLEQIEERKNSSTDPNRKHQGVKVLLVMTPAGSYTEDAESRLRMRQAVVSALSVGGYRAEDEEHLGALKLTWPTAVSSPLSPSKDEHTVETAPFPRGAGAFASGSTALISGSIVLTSGSTAYFSASPALAGAPAPTILIPFEWFQMRVLVPVPKDAPDRVVVLWVPDTLFDKAPLPRLEQLVRALGYKPCSSGNNCLQIDVLGPLGSQMLRKMIPWWEIGETPAKTGSLPTSLPLKDVRMYSWSATAMDEHLHGGWQRDKPRERIAKYLAEQSGLLFINTTATDEALCSELVDELRLRGVDLSKPSESAVVISEWDTFDGRTLPLAFAAEVFCRQRPAVANENQGSAVDMRESVNNVFKMRGEHSPPATSGALNNILFYTYLRGIDGKLPKVPGRAADETSREQPQFKSQEVLKEMQQELDRAEGQNQLDYIPRLAWQLKELEAKIRKGEFNRGGTGRLSAIGVLGSDFYDKLLILQALRPHFPKAVFFTTGLDARFLDPQFQPWTRNLVVAAGFGLSLHPELQGDVPPFRASSQTSLFFAALAALQKIEEKNLDRPPLPRRFEIGRHDAVDLSVLRDRSNIHPAVARSSPSLANFGWLALSGVCIIMLLKYVVKSVRHTMVPIERLHLREKALRFHLRSIVDPGKIKELIKDHLPEINSSFPIPSRHPTPREWADWLNCLLTEPTGWNPQVRKIADLRLLAGPQHWWLRETRRVGLHIDRMARRRLQLEDWLKTSVRSCRNRSQIVSSRLRGVFWGIIGAGVFGFLMGFICWSHFQSDGEPFSLFEGISGWPCILLRAIALFLALFFIAKGRTDLRENEEELTAEFGFDEHSPKRMWRDWPVIGLFRRRRSRAPFILLRARVLCWLRSHYAAIGWNWRCSGDKIRAKDIWSQYQDRSRDLPRFLRALFPMGAYLLLCVCIIKLGGGMPFSPVRGTLDRWVSQVILWAAGVSFLFLNFLVADAARLARTFVEHLLKIKTNWPEPAVKEARSRTGVEERDDLDEILGIRLAAHLTAPVTKLVYYPCIVLAIFIVARSSYFDAWSWPGWLIIVILLNAIWPIHSAFLLQSAAKNAREKAIDSLSQKIGEARLRKDCQGRIEGLERLREEIRATHEGAFTPYLQTPALRALILPFTSFGFANLLNLLTTK